MNRQRLLAQGWRILFALLLPRAVVPVLPAAEPLSPERWRVVVKETAGIRRFGYPVGATFTAPRELQNNHLFQLSQGGKPMLAQFLFPKEADKGTREVRLDFAVSLAPFESREYVVSYGGRLAGPAPQWGQEMDTEAEEFRIHLTRDLEFRVPRNLLGLLHQVRTPHTEYLRTGSQGLMIRYKDHIDFRAGGQGPYGAPTVSRAVKVGPLATTLRFEGTEALRGGRTVRSVVELDFVSTKSWVQVAWTVEDPNGYVAGLGADVNLHLEGEPTLVDFGAGSLVYAALRKGQAALFRAASPGEAWQTFTGPAGRLTPYVVAPRNSRACPAEGWAHVMDRERCTAVAVAEFADAGQENEIHVDSDGRLQLWKLFSQGQAVVLPGTKKITFWLHFVSMPVHEGAATSPQAMLAPLEVEVHAVQK
jgi:hypothetical protein